MQQRWVSGVVATGLLAATAMAVLPAAAQVTIPTTSTTTSRLPKPTSTTARPTTTQAPAATIAPTPTTAKPKPTTSTAPPTTESPTTTIPTPVASPSTTEAIVPISRNSGHFSPALTVLALFGLLTGIGLLVLQWFLTRPGRVGWTL
jgi:hypothetical protein